MKPGDQVWQESKYGQEPQPVTYFGTGEIADEIYAIIQRENIKYKEFSILANLYESYDDALESIDARKTNEI